MDPCPDPPQVNVLSDGHGTLESVGVDRRGRLFFTDSEAGELLMFEDPGAEPKVIADGIDGPGGIVFQRRKGNVLVGFGNTMDQAADGALNPEGGLLRVNPETKEAEVRTEGLQAANGVARGPEHAIFASNALVPGGIDRIERGEMPQLNWGTVLSANGMIADSSRESLFVNQTLTRSSIQRVPFGDPAAATTYFQADPADAAGAWTASPAVTATRFSPPRTGAARSGASTARPRPAPCSPAILSPWDPAMSPSASPEPASARTTCT